MSPRTAKIISGLAPLALLLAIAGCSSDRFSQGGRGYEPEQVDEYAPPPRRRVDAKTNLESGRVYDRQR